MDDVISKITDGEIIVDKFENRHIKKTRLEELYNLVDVIKMAGHLNEEKKNLFITLAELYTQNFRDNLFKDQFDMAKDNIGTTFDEWSMFLNDRLILTYINRHKRTLMKSNAESNLVDPFSKNKRDNLNLLKTLEEKDKAFSNQNIIIMRLPNKYE
jgi:hypothetical protein